VSRLEAYELYRFFHNDAAETFALRGVTLRVDAGELVALVGPSGSGKSTLLACLAGLDTPDGGTVLVEGKRLSRQPEKASAALRARRIGMMMQSGNLFEHMSVTDNVRLQQHLARVKIGGPDWPTRLGIGDRRSAFPSQLSGGEAARAGLAVALSAGADILICDEPTAEVDGATERAIIEVLRERCADGAVAILATHSQALAEAADRILTISDGRLQ
jgi:putative ABC transport system ATP-binding protein